jgi:small subunit ribosomal protein S18
MAEHNYKSDDRKYEGKGGREGREGREGRGDSKGGAAAARPFFRPRRSCPFCAPNAPKIDYKDIKLLSRFVTERGRIMPRRITFVSSKHQRALAMAVKRARFLALMPYVVK